MATITRQQQRKRLRRGGELLASVIMKMSRGQRRLTGRVYGNAAYRRLHELEHELYRSGDHGYREHSAHPSMVKYLVDVERNWNEKQAAQEAEAGDGQGVQLDVQPSIGTEQHQPTTLRTSGSVPNLSNTPKEA